MNNIHRVFRSPILPHNAWELAYDVNCDGDSDDEIIVETGKNDVLLSTFIEYSYDGDGEVNFLTALEEQRALEEMFYGNSTKKGAMNIILPGFAPEDFDEILSILYVPPDAESPENILNALNDDCIREIFQKMPSAEDFLNAADTCSRFQDIALDSYPSKFKQLNIEDTKTGNVLSTTKVEDYLRMFGTSVKSIDWYNIQTEDHAVEILNLISMFCGKTLTQLNVLGLCLDFKACAQFEVLEKLSCNGFNNSQNFPELKYLDMTCYVKYMDDEYVRHFPKLNEVYLNISNIEQIVGFIAKNPQLKSFHLETQRLNASILKSIANHLPNIVDFFIGQIYCCGSYEVFEADLIHINRMRNLKTLNISFERIAMTSLTFDKLIDGFVENDVQIEELTIRSHVQLDEISSIIKLVSLKKLHIVATSQQAIIDIIKFLPNIYSITCLFPMGERFTIAGLKKMMEYGPQLTELDIATISDYEQDDYNLMLGMVEGRLKLNIKCCNVKKNLMITNREWLHIEECNEDCKDRIYLLVF